jgi:MraZ protein
MFAGEFHAHVDTRGTFRLPPMFLAAFPPLAEGTTWQVVLLKSLDHSLWLYEAQGWEAKLEAICHQLDDQQSRLLMHYVVEESILVEPDAHGRLAMPEALRTYADITSEVVLIGLCERIELWSPTRWETYLSELEARHERVLGKILEFL